MKKNFCWISCDFCKNAHKVAKGSYKICKKSIDLDDATAHYIALSVNGHIIQSSNYIEIEDFLKKEVQNKTEKAFA